MSKLRNYKIFILLILSYYLVLILSDTFFNVRDLTYNFYSELYTEKKIEELLNFQEKWKSIIYIVIPFIIFFRSVLVAICLSIGLFFYDMENKLKLKQFFKIGLLGEFVLVLVGFAKLLYFLLIKTDYTLQDIQQFYPLSFINFLNIETLEPWLIYPLQTINLFEVGYFFVLVFGLHKLLENKYWKSFEMVALSYGTGLAIWIGLVMFLTLSIA
jgi:hypothetical protein